ncbi:MAG: hypothetical protein LBK83_05220 [Treponema sp.]|jgi:hypothetical protein|nr:hypothetical protein [Treponema sp.]
MAGMYPADQILSIFGEQVQWPGLDPGSGKFTNGSFTDPLVKPSFIPAETINLILDNLAGLITALGGTPDNAREDQLKNAVMAKLAPLASMEWVTTKLVPLASMEWVKSTVWPIGTVYTQYPATDAAGNPVATGDAATEFPASQAPAALFGGTWIACFENESVFFRSGGKTNLSTDGRSNGKQGDASRNITGGIGGDNNGLAMVNNGNISGVGAITISSNKASFYLNNGTWSGELRSLGINAANAPNSPTASENRPVNRRIIIWKKTAMAV